MPDTEPAGALVPPPRVPPTALATSAPEPPRPERHASVTGRRIGIGGGELLTGMLDRLDRLGDRIAGALGLR